MSDAAIGYGAKFQREIDGAPGTFADIAEVINITGPALAADSVEVTHMASPNGFREYIAGLRDAGEITVEMNWLPNDPSHNPDDAGLAGDLVLGTKKKYRISFPTGSGVNKVWEIEGVVTAWDITVPVDDRQTATATIKVSSIPTFTVV